VTAKRPRPRKAYPLGSPGVWVKPVRRDYRLACCDCGLVHSYNFRLVPAGKRGFQIQYQVARNDRATSAIRRHMKMTDWTNALRAIKKKVGRGNVPVLVTIRERTRYEKRKRRDRR
jgi:hypothetical protein